MNKFLLCDVAVIWKHTLCDVRVVDPTLLGETKFIGGVAGFCLIFVVYLRNKGDFCLRMREKVKNSFALALL